jgi:Ca2+ transporting ATPase
LFLIFLILFNKNEEFFSNSSLLKMGKIAITAVVILIVSIPEGLPLAIKIAMALSVDRLKEDGILIKNLESI